VTASRAARLLWIGLVALAFALASYRILGDLSGFIVANGLVAALALGAAAITAIRRAAAPRPSGLRGPLVEATLRTITAVWIALLLFSAAHWSGVRFDWTFEGQFELSEATTHLLDGLTPADEARATLYYDFGDPRIRNTRLLLEEMSADRALEVRQRELTQFPADEDGFGIGSSNSVVLELGDRWTLVDRPSEGALYEGFARLVHRRAQVVYASTGAGEGDLERFDAGGFSGLRAALETEGYELRPLPLAIAERVPGDAAAVLVLGPERPLTDRGQAALRAYLGEGGRLVAFLGDSPQPSIESILDEQGLIAKEGQVIDPTSGAIEGDPAGLNPVAFNYSAHPVTAGLDSNRMTFFRRSRAFALRKRHPDQKLRPLVHASGDSWVEVEPALGWSRATPHPPAGARLHYWPLVVSSETARDGATTRIVAFGDVELASNRYLRALFNLDLVLNAVHWTTERESSIALRPKTGGRRLNQFPVPLESSLQALYGAGLLVPELLLIAAGWVWLRQRSA